MICLRVVGLYLSTHMSVVSGGPMTSALDSCLTRDILALLFVDSFPLVVDVDDLLGVLLIDVFLSSFLA